MCGRVSDIPCNTSRDLRVSAEELNEDGTACAHESVRRIRSALDVTLADLGSEAPCLVGCACLRAGVAEYDNYKCRLLFCW
ncbi:hypothetical protein PXNS11_290156 [Stutzerimonas xanthomarina]|nr:hypothetical protein PXNS11_290156 [Stutzerimonas xanthomarina]